jgi:hypothetical protein
LNIDLTECDCVSLNQQETAMKAAIVFLLVLIRIVGKVTVKVNVQVKVK